MPHSLTRDVAVVDRLLCDACGLCMPLCPPLAITMRRDGLVVDPETCTSCRKCIAPCPVGALSMVEHPIDNRALRTSQGPSSLPGGGLLT